MIVALFLLILSFIFSQKNKVTYSLWVTKLSRHSDLFSLTLNRGCFLCFYVHFGDWWINCFPSVASRICIITSFIILFICWMYCYFVFMNFFLFTNKQNTSQNQKEERKEYIENCEAQCKNSLAILAPCLLETWHGPWEGLDGTSWGSLWLSWGGESVVRKGTWGDNLRTEK